MKATDDGYPFIILGYMVCPKVVMMGSLKPVLMSMECSLPFETPVTQWVREIPL